MSRAPRGADSPCRSPRRGRGRRTSRCFPAGSMRRSGPRPSRPLFPQGRPQPLLKVEFRIEDLPHEQDDLALRIEAVSATIVPEPREDLAIDANIELDLLRASRRGGPRHAICMSQVLLHDFYKSM